MDDLRSGRALRTVIALAVAVVAAAIAATLCHDFARSATGAGEWFLVFTTVSAFISTFALVLHVQARHAKRKWLDARVERIPSIRSSSIASLAHLVLAGFSAAFVATHWWSAGCKIVDVARVPRDDPFRYWHRGSPAWSAIAFGAVASFVAMFVIVVVVARWLAARRIDRVPRAVVTRSS